VDIAAHGDPHIRLRDVGQEFAEVSTVKLLSGWFCENWEISTFGAVLCKPNDFGHGNGQNMGKYFEPEGILCLCATAVK